MGQTCTKPTCYSVEQDAGEGSRADSPDPVMYDIMRKSIQATHEVRRRPSLRDDSGSSCESHSNSSPHRDYSHHAAAQHSRGSKASKRGLTGQCHLLYKNSGSSPVSKFESGSGDYHQTNQGCNSDIAPWADASGAGGTGGGSYAADGRKRNHDGSSEDLVAPYPTRLLTRRRSQRGMEEGGGTHIYAIRYPESSTLTVVSHEQAPTSTPTRGQEQCPPRRSASQHKAAAQSSSAASSSSGNRHSSASTKHASRSHSSSSSSARKASTTKTSRAAASSSSTTTATPAMPATSMFSPAPVMEGGDIFTSEALAPSPSFKVLDWVTVSHDHKIYVADVGLSSFECDHIVRVTEDVCRGQYAAYTYAKQTLGCREFPTLAHTCFHPVHTIVHAIGQRLNGRHLQLDDREPHVVKYDITRKERQKLDMHTDKSEWTFLIALSNGCGVDYEGGGTYFECLDSTVHIQRGHALIFPGKLRHCGQKITSGLRFLLVGFLVDKAANPITGVTATGGTATSTTASSATATTITTAAGDSTKASSTNASKVISIASSSSTSPATAGTTTRTLGSTRKSNASSSGLGGAQHQPSNMRLASNVIVSTLTSGISCSK